MYCKRILAIAAICLHAAVSNAQTTFRGRVTAEDGTTPLAAATLRLPDGRTLVADAEGRFSFGARVPDGGLRLQVSSIGHRTLDTLLQRADAGLTIRLHRLNALMQPIEIRAVRAGATAPFTERTLHARALEGLNNGQDIPFVLNRTPSVVAHSDAGNGVGYTGLRIRGTDATRINVTLNGIPYNDAESQGLFFVNLPDFTSSAGSIQVQRGVGTSSNGTGAFGATINIATNDAREEAYGELHNGFGSFNTWRHTLKAGTGLLNGHYTFDARLSRITSDGYMDRASSDLQAFHVSAAYLDDGSSLRFNVFSGKEKTYQAWYGIPADKLVDDRRHNPAGTERPGTPYDNETDNYRQTHYQLFHNRRLSERLDLQAALFYTRGAGYYEQYKADEDHRDYGVGYPVFGRDTVRRTDLVRQLWLDNHFFGQTLSLQYRRRGREVIGGGGFSRYIGGHYGEVVWAQQGIDKGHRWYDLDAFKNDVNMYVKWQEALGERLSLFADLQYRHVEYTLNGFRNNPDLRVRNRWDFLNPKLGLTVRLPKGRAYLSWAMANKEPNRDDFEAGARQQPRQETLHDLEAGYAAKGGAAEWSATAYYMRYRDQLVLTGMINDVGAYARTNIPESHRLGLELEGAWRPVDRFRAEGNITVSDNRIFGFTAYYDDYDNGGQLSERFERSPISFSPWLTAAGTLAWKPAAAWELSLTGKYVSRQYLDNTGKEDRSLDPFLVQDLLLEWKPAVRFARELALRMQVNNLFDARYEPNGYTFSYRYGGALNTENYFYPMAGTHFMAGISLKW